MIRHMSDSSFRARCIEAVCIKEALQVQAGDNLDGGTIRRLESAAQVQLSSPEKGEPEVIRALNEKSRDAEASTGGPL